VAVPTAPKRFAICCASGLEDADNAGTESRHCIATLSYVYDHAARELPKGLT